MRLFSHNRLCTYKVFGLIALILSALAGLFGILYLNTNNQRIYNNAKRECPTEIWLIYRDISPTLAGGPVHKPYPEEIKDVLGHTKLYDYGCSLDEAKRKQMLL